MKYILDRFEEDFAVLEKEEGGTVDVKITFLPDAKEGDVIVEENGVYFVDKRATEKRKSYMEEKIKRLFGKN